MPVLVRIHRCTSFRTPSHEPRDLLSDSGGLVLWWLSKWWGNASLVLTKTYISLLPGCPLIDMSLHPAMMPSIMTERRGRRGISFLESFGSDVLALDQQMQGLLRLSWSALTRRQFPARQESLAEFRHLSLLCNSRSKVTIISLM